MTKERWLLTHADKIYVLDIKCVCEAAQQFCTIVLFLHNLDIVEQCRISFSIGFLVTYR